MLLWSLLLSLATVILRHCCSCVVMCPVDHDDDYKLVRCRVVLAVYLVSCAGGLALG